MSYAIVAIVAAIIGYKLGKRRPIKYVDATHSSVAQLAALGEGIGAWVEVCGMQYNGNIPRPLRTTEKLLELARDTYQAGNIKSHTINARPAETK